MGAAPRTVFDLDDARPPWNHTVCVGGVALPLLAPDEVGAESPHAAEATPRAPRGLRHLPTLARDGLYRLWHGSPRPGSGASVTAHLRRQVAVVIPPDRRSALDALGATDLMKLWWLYVGYQQAWCAEIAAQAKRAAERAYYEASPEKFAEGVGFVRGMVNAANARAQEHPRAGMGVMVPVTPGGRLPATMGGHRVGRGADARVRNGKVLGRREGGAD